MSKKYTFAKTATPTELREKPPLKGRYVSHEKFMESYEKIRRRRHELYKKLADM